MLAEHGAGTEMSSAAHGSTRHSARVDERGLDRDGTIAREGALDRVPAVFAPVVDAARAQITKMFAMLIDDLGPWLATEYTAVHGERAPRP